VAPSAVERLKAPIYTTVPGVECSGVEGSRSFESRLIVYTYIPFLHYKWHYSFVQIKNYIICN
jgi:hypothetical protein